METSLVEIIKLVLTVAIVPITIAVYKILSNQERMQETLKEIMMNDNTQHNNIVVKIEKLDDNIAQYERDNRVEHTSLLKELSQFKLDNAIEHQKLSQGDKL